MGYWSDLFKKGNRSNERFDDDLPMQQEQQLEDSFLNGPEVELNFDRDGWLLYPNGVKLKIIDKESYINYDYQEIIESLGYHKGELYIDYYQDSSNHKVLSITPAESDLIAFSELFTDKLIFILRYDGKVMTIGELDDLKLKMKSNQIPVWGLSRSDLLYKIGRGIEDESISRQFLERVLNFTCESNDEIDVDKFHFMFDFDILTDCSYDDYSIFIFISDYHFSFTDLENYLKYANKSNRLDWRMKEIIGEQCYYASKIDNDIIMSEISRKKFSYNYEENCINYIAMAAYYKQEDVREKQFIFSTDGDYEILSKETHNGMITTRIKAYHEVFTFINGHSMPESFLEGDHISSSTLEAENDYKNGFIYVMINPSFDGLVKIGKTKRDPNERAKELSSATGVPTPFIVVFYKQFRDCDYTEQQIHKYLEELGYRVKDNREFFSIPTNSAIEIVQKFYNKEQNEDFFTDSFNTESIDISNLYGKWKPVRMKMDETSLDLSKEEYTKYGITMIFKDDFTFEDFSERFSSHSGFYIIINEREIETYVADGKYLTYRINSLSENYLHLTVIVPDDPVNIEYEFEKQIE